MDNHDAAFKTVGHKVFLDGPDRLVMKEGGGCVKVIGVAMLAAGVFFILGGTTSLWNWPPGVEIPGVKWPVGMLVLGMVLSVLGLSSATHHARTVFDRSKRTWVRKGGVLFVIDLRTRGSFDDLEAVRIARETRSTSGRVGRSTAFTYYPVSIGCKTAEGKRLRRRLGALDGHEEAVKLADAVAGFLGVPVREEEDAE